MNDYLIVNLMSDFIYLPYTNKESVFVTSKTVKKNDIICEYNNKKVYSPVSGNAYAYSEIPSIDGITKVVIIENDFKDTTSPSYQKESIYDITDKELIEIFPKKESITLDIHIENKYDLKDYYILKDNIKNVLETLNLINERFDTKIYINLNKKDISSYKLLLSYLGTYPNISVIFNKVTTNTYNLYEIIDIYNKIKNIKERDYIYISIVYNNTFLVNKVKKYSNLKDILESNQLIGKYYLINNNIKITNSNYLLDERVSQIVIK